MPENTVGTFWASFLEGHQVSVLERETLYVGGPVPVERAEQGEITPLGVYATDCHGIHAACPGGW